MLKITIHPEGQVTKLVLEGRLTGLWVRELDRCWQEVVPVHHGEVVVDLSGVSFVDSDGKMLLSRMWQRGAQLQAVGCLNRCIVEEITKVGLSAKEGEC